MDDEHMAIAITRNPWGHREDEVREASLAICDALEQARKELESCRDAYTNMRDFAVESGLDVTCYAGGVSDVYP